VSAAFRSAFGEITRYSDDEILGRLSAAASDAGFATHYHAQTDAWRQEIAFVRNIAHACELRLDDAKSWTALFEFEIPRRGKRPDVVVLAGELIFVIEFKVGATNFTGTDEWQVLSYALDLRDFHQGSLNRVIAPILVATHAQMPVDDEAVIGRGASLVLPVVKIGDAIGEVTAEHLCREYARHHRAGALSIDARQWEMAPYRPTPTIIEAAQTLFAGHNVVQISHAFATNLDVTSTELIRAIAQARASRERLICFVTGLPGAGKTLAGLNAVHDPALRGGGPSAVFLSGNGPLVKIVREALVRDRHRGGESRTAAARVVATFIDNVHRFIDNYGIRRQTDVPYENAIVFDEAQRAWNAEAVASQHNIEKSEPTLILDIMERAPDWCAVVALVGGGQEINTGEAGLEAWGRALNERSAPWRVLASPEVLAGGQSVAGHRLFDGDSNPLLRIEANDAFHLRSSVRSPRDRYLGAWVNSLLSTSESPVARNTMGRSAEYPIALTRDLEQARDWLREHSDGDERAGLLASSGALRLRHHGIEVSSGFRKGYSYEDWFLASRDDTRSSSWLEVAATEFECQGLELDWAGVCWGGDLVRQPNARTWNCRSFRGSRWMNVRQPARVRYAINKYRVLLTRARKGMIIWVPRGDNCDPTREPELLDATAEYLISRGVTLL